MKKSSVKIRIMSMMSRLMLSCESAGILISKRQHAPLKLGQKISLRMHLMSCKLCQRFEDDLSVIHSGIEHYKNFYSTDCADVHLDENQKKEIAKELGKQ